MGENKFSSPNAYAGNRRGRRIAAIVGGTCAFGAGIIILIAFLMTSSTFTTVIDQSKHAEDAVFLHLKPSPSASESAILLADPIDKAWTSTAKTVLSWYEDVKKQENGLTGTQIFTRDGIDNEQLAWCNSFYLSNSSPDKALSYQFNLSISNYQKPSNDAVSIYNYIRIVVAVEQNGVEERYWYAARSSTQGTDEGASDYREAVSKVTINDEGYRVSLFSDGETKYCEIFGDDSILTFENAIQPGQTTRFSIIAYLEGEDPDCRGNAPQGESFVLKGDFALI